MSDQIYQSYVQQYTPMFYMLAQQKGSRLRACCRNDGKIVGKRVFFDRIGATAAVKSNARWEDTPIVNSAHSRRSNTLQPYKWADFVDKMDLHRILTDPTSAYTVNATNAMGRGWDDEILAAMLGSSYEGETGSSTVAFPSAQVIADNDQGITLEKLTTAKQMLLSAEVDEDQEELFMTYSGKTLKDLLNISEFVSGDFNIVKALVEGRVTKWMGFNWIHSERTSFNSSTSIRKNVAWAKSGVGAMASEEITVDIGPRRDKSNATQVYVEMDVGAIRIEDAKVIEVDCYEP